jgi:hypothetical protein
MAIEVSLRKMGILLLPLVVLRASVSTSTLARRRASAKIRYGARVLEGVEIAYLEIPAMIRTMMLE